MKEEAGATANLVVCLSGLQSVVMASMEESLSRLMSDLCRTRHQDYTAAKNLGSSCHFIHEETVRTPL